MSRPPLPDWRVTFRNAEKHLRGLERTVQRYTEGNPYRSVAERNPQTGEYVVRAKLRRPVPPSVAPGIQDTLANFRFALDQLAHALKAGAFPVCLTHSDFHKHTPTGALDARGGLAKLQGAAPAVRAAVEALQPYRISPAAPQQDALALLNVLRNRAHRTLHVAFARAPSVGFPLPDLRDPHLPWVAVNGGQRAALAIEGLTLPAGPFVDGAEVARLAPQSSGYQPKMDVSFYGPFEVTFDPKGPARGAPVLVTLTRIRDHILNGVFPILEPLA